MSGIQDAYFGDVLIKDPSPDPASKGARDRDAILVMTRLAKQTPNPVEWMREQLDAAGLSALAVEFRDEIRAERSGVPVPAPEPELVPERRPAPAGQRLPIVHGTANGFRTHRRRGEEACEPCGEALRVEAREKRAAKNPTGPRDRTPPVCGTIRGWRRHHADGTDVCDLCRAAKAQLSRDARAAAKNASSS